MWLPCARRTFTIEISKPGFRSERLHFHLAQSNREGNVHTIDLGEVFLTPYS